MKKAPACPAAPAPIGWRAFYRNWIKPALVAAIIILPLKSAIGECNFVPSGSMNPTILEGDFIFVDKLAYDLKVPFTTIHLAQWANPQSGDIIVFFSPDEGTRLVKRVIGLPGDTVELRNERLFINGQALAYGPLDPSATQDYAPEKKLGALFANETLPGRTHAMMVLPQRPALRTYGPVTVPTNSYFVMGDNRDNSRDSRYFGLVPRDQIVGQAKTVVASVDLDHWATPRSDRFFSKLN